MAELVLEGIKKSFGAVDVIHGIDLAIHDGEFVVLVGPSGCGKSTLLRMIAGLEQITAGTLKIDGRVVNDVETRERDIAMVFQSYALYPHMTVRENINFPLKVRGLDKAAGDQRVIEACDMIGLGDLLARKPKALSGGQRQRVAMGRSVVRHPRVFLFDEPLSNLDAKLRVQMRRQIRDLHRRIGATSIYVTHDQVEAMTLADRIVLLDQGYVQQIGTPLELYREPANRFVASFIGSPEMNLLEGVVEAAERGMIARIGPDFAIPIGAGSVADGTPVTVGIRPADIAVGAGDVTGAVIECEILGSETHLLIGRGGHEIQISVPGIAPSAAGDKVPLRFAPENVHLFSRDTGTRL